MLRTKYLHLFRSLLDYEFKIMSPDKFPVKLSHPFMSNGLIYKISNCMRAKRDTDRNGLVCFAVLSFLGYFLYFVSDYICRYDRYNIIIMPNNLRNFRITGRAFTPMNIFTISHSTECNYKATKKKR